MPEPIEWLPDGTPYSPRFGDRYHSENGGLDQARQVFLHGCGLPAAWAGLPQWRVLETGFGFGLNFLVTWAAWRADPHRPQQLHFVSTEAWPVSATDLLRATAIHPELAPLARALHDQWWGLLPGVHRLRFEDGRVLLTLYVGDSQSMLRQQKPTVDCVYLDGFSPQCNPDSWSLHTLKAVARCCRRGARLATWTIARSVRDGLAQCGFEVMRVPGVPPKRDNLHATYNPHWEPRNQHSHAADYAPLPAGKDSAQCVVIGGGLAGAATASSLARRGWQVHVLDQAAEPAAGASGLPAGVFAPHVSPDDSVLSRLSRSGVRMTLQQAGEVLEKDVDWSPCGVLEHRTDGTPGLSADWRDGPGAQWSELASELVRAQAGLTLEARACWHHQAGWIRPARLIAALLAQPGIHWHGNSPAARLERVDAMAEDGSAPAPAWKVLATDGQVLAEAPLVVIAAGAGSGNLLQHRWPLQPVRGQVSWGLRAETDTPLVPFPVNGNGNLVPRFPVGGRHGSSSAWVMGSTFERDVDMLPPTPAEVQAAHAANLDKLQALLPTMAPRLRPALDSGEAQSWAGVRCSAPDRLPIVGTVDAAGLPGLWVCTAMGSRGLTMALLCGELLAARLHGEPLPLDARLAKSLGSERL